MGEGPCSATPKPGERKKREKKKRNSVAKKEKKT
jgi:hypothetical protein